VTEASQPPSAQAQALRGGGRGSAWLSEGVVLAAAPFLGYLGTYLRERGFADYFAIPQQLISVNLGDVLSFTFGFAVALTGAVIGVDFFRTVIGQEDNPMRLPSLISIAVLAVSFLEMVLFGLSLEQWKYWGIPLAILVAGWGYLIVAPHLKHGFVASASLPREEQPSDLRAHTILDELMVRFGPGVLVVVIYIAAGLFVGWSLGRAEAVNKVDYLVPASNPSLVVLRIYGDTVVAANFDRRHRRVGRDFVIWKISGQGVRLNLRRVGPLRH
jgi:hypothetical protein